MNETDLPLHLQGLNPPQLEAVRHVNGPILILAGAGSGKTRVLTRRVANLVLEHDIAPWRILAVTFTNKASDEMRERLRGLLGRRADDLWAATFHSSALRILRRHAQLLSYTNNFVIYDDQDSKSLLKRVLKDAGVDVKKHGVNEFARAIDLAKNECVSPEAFARDSLGSGGNIRAEIYDRYQKALMQADAMDFGDLLMNAVLLFQQHPEVLSRYRDQLHYVLVDEFQDTNKVQYLFVRQLVEPRRNLFVVGDDDQSIYMFRGATISNILNFEKDYSETVVVKLEQNYRSTGNILETAHAVIEKNEGRKSKKLWTAGDKGSPICLYAGWDEGEEAAFVAAEIRKHVQLGGRYSDISIFYRTNAQSRALEEALVDSSIPYRIFGALKFYERKEIKDILAYLRLIANRADSQSFLRVLNTPPRGIGAQALNRILSIAKEEHSTLWQAAAALRDHSKHIASFMTLIEGMAEIARTAPLGDLIHETVSRSGYQAKLKESSDITAVSRLENLKELQAIGIAMQGAGENPLETLRLFLDRVSLTASDEAPQEDNKEQAADAEQEKPDMVSLMTLHLAKGLEFPLVFLTGMEEGLLPHYRAIDGDGDIEEERRLCYVGMTRAMRELVVTRARKRGMFSAGGAAQGELSSWYREPSRFMYDVPQGFTQSKGGDFFGFEFGGGGDREDSLDDDDAYEAEEAPAAPRIWKRKAQPKKTKLDARSFLKIADELK